MITTLFIMVCALGVALFHKRSASGRSRQPVLMPAPAVRAVDVPALTPAMSGVSWDVAEIKPDPLVVREIDDGLATLMVRHRSRRRACTAHLIVWSGHKHRRIRDAYYDLGRVDAEGIGEALVQQFIEVAKQRLTELKGPGRRTRGTALCVPVAMPAPAAPPSAKAPAETPIRMKPFPSVYRGTVLEIGYMPRALNGQDVQSFGVRYRTPEGAEDVVWGVNLRTALLDARAAVGDEVEILKIGRKTMEEGKAPMNLFQVHKIESRTSH